MPNKQALIAEMKAELAAARAITVPVDNAGREYTPAEQAAVRNHLAKSEQIKVQLDALKDDERIKAAVADLGNAIGHNTSKGTSWAATKQAKRSEWAKSTTERIEKVQSSSGVKALVSGSIDVATPIFPDISRIGSYPTRVLDLLVDRVSLDGTNTYSWLKQTVRTNNAAPVADNATKPTSIFTFAEVEDRVRVIAHLSEATPERYLADHNEIGDFLQDEMEEGLKRVLEAQIMAGDGTGENFTGVLETSGIQVQAWSTDLLETTRKAATKLDVLGETPNAWVMHPSDVETLDLLQDNEARHFYQGPQQQIISGQSPVWSLPIVKSTAVPAGTGLLGDFNQLRLVVREDTRFDIDRSGTLFTKNQFVARLEGRFGLAVRRPAAFVEVDLAA